MLKNGETHTAGLRDGRAVLLDGERVGDVTTHPAFRNAVGSVAGLFDFAAAPANRELMTFGTPEGGRANRIWQLPESHADLLARRAAIEAWAGRHCGFLGRAPDHVASCISGMYMGLEVFEAHDPRRAGALAEYYRYARDRDLYLAYVIINPQADRSRGAGGQADPFLAAGIVDRDAGGITVRGAKMLATGGIMADEVLVTCIQPLAPGEERYAVSFAVPVGTRGVTLLSRRSYEQAAASVFDSPLASRFDENDAVIHLEDVRVPWERVFVAGDVAMCQRQFHATPAHVFQNYQAMIRLTVKLRFLAGLARRIAELNGIDGFPQVRETLGQLAAEAGMVDALVAAMEVRGTRHGRYFVPHRHTLYAAQTLTQPLYGRVLTALRELAGGGLIALPSSVRDLDGPESGPLVARTQQSPVAGATEKVKLLKLAWDAVGSEFASRHAQYEMFYAGASFVTRGHSLRTYDWDAAAALVDGMLGGYDRHGATAG